MRELSIINEQEVLGREFKVYGTIEEPLFLAKDVSNWIEHSNITMMLKNVDEDEQVKIRPKQSLGLLTNNNEYNFLTEDGLYEVLMQSRKPIAKRFKKQVKQILKNLRLNRISIENNTDKKEVDVDINELMKTINNLTQIVSSISEQNNILSKFLTENSNIKSDDNKSLDNKCYNEEESILSKMSSDFITTKECSDIFNSLGIFPRRIGINHIYQVCRDNGLLTNKNFPLNLDDNNFKIMTKNKSEKMFITKQGIVTLYKLCRKDIVTCDYQFRGK
ncbi:MAG: Bro-N domain-containing protein [Bacilli bacterium]